MLANTNGKPFNVRKFAAQLMKEIMLPMTVPELTLPCFAIVIGLIVLVWSADKFVYGAASLARRIGMSTLMIGLTIVALGTSAPEILVSIVSSLNGSPILAIGNALGSNIANIGLVLGITTLVCALPIQPRLRRKELPILLAVTIGAIALLANKTFAVWDGLILLAALACFLLWLILDGKRGGDIVIDEDEIHVDMSTRKAVAWFLFALALLLCSSKLLVWGATEIAVQMEIDEVIIGLTIVAIGTSLPELAASVASALKGHHDIAIGNIIGSNILNLLAVMPFPGLIAPSAISGDIFWRDGATVLGLTALLALFIYASGKNGKLGRFHGISFLCIYGGYLWILYQASTTQGI